MPIATEHIHFHLSSNVLDSMQFDSSIYQRVPMLMHHQQFVLDLLTLCLYTFLDSEDNLPEVASFFHHS